MANGMLITFTIYVTQSAYKGTKFGEYDAQMKFYKLITFYVKRGCGQGHVTYFLNFGTSSVTFERKKLDT